MSSNILLVDDSEALRNIVKIYLMNLRTGFIEAETGQQALELLGKEPVSLIIADTELPELDGIAFCREVRSSKNEAVRNVPLILLATQKTESLRKEVMEAGANDFLLKPLAAAQLLESVRRLLPEI